MPILSQNIHRIVTTPWQPQQAAIRYQHRMPTVFKRLGLGHPRFDLLHLGMGDDGHTASLFPNSPVLRQTLQQQPWAAAAWVPHLHTWRITLTPQALGHAKKMVFLLAGKGKAHRLAQVLQGPHASNALPSQKVWRASKQQCHWFVDQAAARCIK